MERDDSILKEIARDKEVVGWLEKAVEEGTLMRECPTPQSARPDICNFLCWKYWPNLKGVCPYDKYNLSNIAQDILALSDLTKPDTYRVGDVFEIEGDLFLLCRVGYRKIQCISLYDNCYRREDPTTVPELMHVLDCLPFEIIREVLNIKRSEPYKYIGRFCEVFARTWVAAPASAPKGCPKEALTHPSLTPNVPTEPGRYRMTMEVEIKLLPETEPCLMVWIGDQLIGTVGSVNNPQYDITAHFERINREEDHE